MGTNFFKGMLRANKKMYGDLEGSVTKLKRGRLAVSIEKGVCIAWAVGSEDIELSRSTIKDVELISKDQIATDLPSGGGQRYQINVYRLTFKNGATGILRLTSGDEYKVLQLIK